MKRSFVVKVVTASLLAGGLAFGLTSIASASSTAVPVTHAQASTASAVHKAAAGTLKSRLCARAPRLENRLDNLVAKAQKRVTTLTAREAKLKAAGKTTAAQRVAKRINRLDAVEARLTKIVNRIEKLCSTGSTTNAPVSTS